MKKLGLLVVFVLMLLSGERAYAYDDHDFQVWNTDTEEVKVGKDLKVALEEEIRFGNNADDFYYHHYDAGIFYNLSKYLNVGAGYRHIFSKSKGKFKAESEPYMTATLSGEYAGFKFDDRSRLEYQHFGYQTDLWRYRNKFTLKFPWKFTKLEIQPYVSDEIFIRLGGMKVMNQNRFSSGFGLNLVKNVKVEIYYMLVSSKGVGRWTDTNVLGTKIKISF